MNDENVHRDDPNTLVVLDPWLVLVLLLMPIHLVEGRET